MRCCEAWSRPCACSRGGRDLSLLRNFIAVLIDHRRVVALPEIARQFELDLNERLGMADAEVTSARALSPGSGW